MPTAYLALGSNLGDRRAQLERALALLGERGVTVQRVSSYRETDAGRRARAGRGLTSTPSPPSKRRLTPPTS